MKLYKQGDIIKRLNKEVSKDMMPRSGKITPQNFSKKNKDGAFNHRDMDGKRKLFSWEDVAPAYGIKVKKSTVSTEEKIKEKVESMTSESLGDSLTNDILLDFATTLQNRLSGATTTKQEVEIEKMSYDALVKKLEAQEKIGNLISVDDAKRVIEYTIGNIKSKMYELQPKLKTQYPQLKDRDIVEIGEMIDTIFSELHGGDIF